MFGDNPAVGGTKIKTLLVLGDEETAGCREQLERAATAYGGRLVGGYFFPMGASADNVSQLPGVVEFLAHAKAIDATGYVPFIRDFATPRLFMQLCFVASLFDVPLVLGLDPVKPWDEFGSDPEERAAFHDMVTDFSSAAREALTAMAETTMLGAIFGLAEEQLSDQRGIEQAIGAMASQIPDEELQAYVDDLVEEAIEVVQGSSRQRIEEPLSPQARAGRTKRRNTAIRAMHAHGMSPGAISTALNGLEVPAPGGEGPWSAAVVKTVLRPAA